MRCISPLETVRSQALEMAEALNSDNEQSISSVGWAEADEIITHLWQYISCMRDDMELLNKDCTRLREELDIAHGVVR